MPITTRSRATGIVKKIKVEDSLDLSDSVSSGHPVKREPKFRRANKKLSLDSEFELTAGDSTSESRTVEESSVSDFVAKEVESVDEKVVVFSTRTSRSGRRTRSRLGGISETPYPVEKLYRFPDAHFATSLDSLRDSIKSQLDVSLEFPDKDDIFRVNRVLQILKQHKVREVFAFANSSFIGVPKERVAAYWTKLYTIALELLSTRH